MKAVLVAVAAAPPKTFSGGGRWEAMHGDMTGYFEAKARMQNRHYRLFCLLDYEAIDSSCGLLVVLTGQEKKNATLLSDAFYAKVRELGEEYKNRNPRSLLS